MDQAENVIIIGGGPAGLAAAVYIARANLQPLLFGGAPYGGQLMLTSEVENYPGYDHILGPELIEKMRDHAKKFGTKILDQNITKVLLNKSPFELQTVDKSYFAKTVLIATGAQALWLGLESEERLRGKGVSACATCDGFFFKDKEIAVVGGGDSAMEEALFLTKFASKITLFHRRDQFRASKIMQDRVLNHPKIKVEFNTEVLEVLGNDKVEGVKVKNNQTNQESELKIAGLFVAIGHKPDTDLFKEQVLLDKKGYVVTTNRFALENFKEEHPSTERDTEERARTAIQTAIEGDLEEIKKKFDPVYGSQTSVSGVFAAGDCVDHVYRQAATAVGMGVAAALEAEKWLELNV